jgi:hypothetical protein
MGREQTARIRGILRAGILGKPLQSVVISVFFDISRCEFSGFPKPELNP